MPTQAYPQQAFSPAAVPKGKSNGMLIGGGLVVAAALVGGVVLLTGGDDKKSTSITLAPIESSTSTAANSTTSSSPVVITLPPTVATLATAPATTDSSGAEVFTDDTGMFSVFMPTDLPIDTSPVVSADGITIPSITAADDLEAYRKDYTTFGMLVQAFGPSLGSFDAAQVLAFVEPSEGVCTGRTTDIGFPTSIGAATRVSLTGCGSGLGNVVILVVQLADRPDVVAISVQSLGTIESIQPLAQVILETIQVA